MRIAVTYENGKIFQHFGHCEEFRIYETKDNAIESARTVYTEGSGHGALAGFLKNQGVEALICGGIGGGARQALDEAGILLYPGAAGDADEAVQGLLSQTLVYNPNEMCGHHHEAGSCGNHGESSCGNHGGSACGNPDAGECGADRQGCRGNM
ncbi:MAG TPA: NifB/NifX family molybdenum-iron cluster-binding protein [Lachnospiraceae bacterium]|nr:NifB/NifX family molybdenum-iron cluster-binding protein [Lachnospiraceae bacterium]